ncbi:MAG: MBG domain-containing protein [Betaproteobacteria bacterium]
MTVSTKAASKTYDGIAFGGGNGVVYSGFVGGESSAVLGGMLSYGGTSQGAIAEGTYLLTAQSLSSSNYAISYISSTLTVKPAPYVPIAAARSDMGTAPPPVNSALPLEPPLVFATATEASAIDSVPTARAMNNTGPDVPAVAAPVQAAVVPPSSLRAVIAIDRPGIEQPPTAPVPLAATALPQTVVAAAGNGRSVLRMEAPETSNNTTNEFSTALQPVLSQVQQGMAGSTSPGEALDALASSLARSAGGQGLSKAQIRPAVKAFESALGVLLSNGISLEEAVLRAQGSFATERALAPDNPSPQATVISVVTTGSDADAQLSALANSQSSRGMNAFDKSIGVHLAKGLPVNEALRLAQQAAKLEDRSNPLDQSPLGSLVNGLSDPASAFSAASPVFDQALGAQLGKGVPLPQALLRAEAASKAAAASARADKRAPATALALGDALFLEGLALDGASSKVLGNSLARGADFAQALDKAASAKTAVQQGQQADARSDLFGFSSGSGNVPQGSQDFDRALANALNRGDTPTRALLSARKAMGNMPADIQTPSTALSSGLEVESLLASPGNSRAYQMAFGNALAKGTPVDQAQKLAAKAELASAFRFPLKGAAARLAGIGLKTSIFKLEDGKPLPPWLRFAPELKSLLIADAPDGALPANVVVSVGRQSARITVSEGRARP